MSGAPLNDSAEEFPGAIIELCALLPRLAEMHFVAEPAADSATGWQGHGHARLSVEADGGGWRVQETGRFLPAGAARDVAFTNVYHWQRTAGGMTLSHERFGASHPVTLVDLVPDRADRLVAASPHHCGADQYHATLRLQADGFDLVWDIRGPAKYEHLSYHYRRAAR